MYNYRIERERKEFLCTQSTLRLLKEACQRFASAKEIPLLGEYCCKMLLDRGLFKYFSEAARMSSIVGATKFRFDWTTEQMGYNESRASNWHTFLSRTFVVGFQGLCFLLLRTGLRLHG